MPPRYVTWAILAFWLATSGWLIHRELWPRLESQEPTLFEMDVTDEARIGPSRPKANVGGIRWQLTWNEEHAGSSVTFIHHTPEDPYELYGQFTLWPPGPIRAMPLLGIDSRYHVDWDGHCRKFSAEFIPDRSAPELRGAVLTRLEGWLRNRQCGVDWLSPIPDGRKRELEAVPISDRGNVLNLLHPLNRMPGLAPGQRWQMPLVDPLAIFAEGPSTALRLVEAEVHEDGLQRQQRLVPCWLVTYSQDGALLGRTWVRSFDALVLQQEMRVRVDLGVVKPGDRLMLSRDAEN